MSKFVPSKITMLKAYEWGLQIKKPNLIKLNTNENPYPPAPQVTAALQVYASSDLALYPDPQGTELKATIADYYGLDNSNIFLGNGSDDVIAHCFQAFLNQKTPLIMPEFSYGLYEVMANLYEIPYRKTSLKSDFSLEITDYKENESVILIANPNAPGGNLLSKQELKEIITTNTDYLVIVDEAYCDFASESVIELIPQFDNLIVIQTLSKSRSLAGLRVGLALGNHELIKALHTIRDCLNPYNVNALALEITKYAFKDEDYFKKTTKTIIRTREAFKKDLLELGFDITPSQTNFVLVSHPLVKAKDFYDKLFENNILVRYFKFIDKGEYLRISIGLPEEMKKVVQILKSIVMEDNQDEANN